MEVDDILFNILERIIDLFNYLSSADKKDESVDN
jgi:hypothetical protein